MKKCSTKGEQKYSCYWPNDLSNINLECLDKGRLRIETCDSWKPANMQNTNRSLHPTIITAKDFGPTTSITPQQPGCSYFLLVILRISSYSKKTHHPCLLISPARTTECTYRSIFNRGLIFQAFPGTWFPGWWTSSSPTVQKNPVNQPTYQPAKRRFKVIQKTGGVLAPEFLWYMLLKVDAPIGSLPASAGPPTNVRSKWKPDADVGWFVALDLCWTPGNF